MNFLLIILLAIYGVQGISDPTTSANAGEFNYFVMVWHSGKFYCGGIIIDQRHILTKGSCVIGIPSPHLSIIAGTIDAKVSKIRPLQVESVHIHYGFKAIVEADVINWLHNIAILRLVNRMVWSLHVAPAVLVTGNYHSRTECVVPSWRHTLIGRSREHYYIRWNIGFTHNIWYCIGVGVRPLKNEGCASWTAITKIYARVTQYYSGSPIVCQNVVIGIVDGRKSENLHVFLKLLPYKDFIEHFIDDRKYDVNPEEINYIVSVWYEYRFKCGGIIFDALHILTTAGCVKYASHTRLQVIAGRTQVLQYEDQIHWLSVNNIEIHPDYEEIIHFEGSRCMHSKNNYALLTLVVPLEWGPNIGPAPISNTHFVPTNCSCRAYRWHNAYTVDDEVLFQLIWSQEVIMNAEVCQKAGIGLEADEICVNSQYAQHPRNFDSSGNPVVCQGSVMGIITSDYSTVPQFSQLTGVHGVSDSTIVAKAGEFNYFVMVWHNGKFQCGGTIIDQRHIMTKGSCVLGIPSPYLSIIAEIIDTRVSEIRPWPVESVHIHYGFKAIVEIDGIDWLHDIAILRLVNRMVWDLLLAPAALKTGGNYFSNKCVVPGWRHAFVHSLLEHYYIHLSFLMTILRLFAIFFYNPFNLY